MTHIFIPGFKVWKKTHVARNLRPMLRDNLETRAREPLGNILD